MLQCTLEMDERGRIAFFRSPDGTVFDLSAENEVSTIIAKVLRRRQEQDEQWGGPQHDDEHHWADWVNFITKCANRSQNTLSHVEFERCMVDVAALAFAAIESSERKRVRVVAEKV
jgi:hypothetical protein